MSVSQKDLRMRVLLISESVMHISDISGWETYKVKGPEKHNIEFCKIKDIETA